MAPHRALVLVTAIEPSAASGATPGAAGIVAARQQLAARRPQMDASSAVTDEILLERLRQVDGEGNTPRNDDVWRHGQLAAAGACYAMNGLVITNEPLRQRVGTMIAELWPWSSVWWKPKDRRADLIRAAALLVAEIERLDRAKGNPHAVP